MKLTNRAAIWIYPNDTLNYGTRGPSAYADVLTKSDDCYFILLECFEILLLHVLYTLSVS